MNIDDEPAALLALFHKYKPSPSDFLLAQMAAKLESIEILLVGLAHPHDAKQRHALGARTDSDVLHATEAYLQFLCPLQSGDDEPSTIPSSN
jgi:hypothetical protein